MKRQMIAGITALALALSGMAIQPAAAKDKNNTLKLLLGAAAIGILLNQMNGAQAASPRQFLGVPQPRDRDDNRFWGDRDDDDDGYRSGYGHAIRAGTVPGECLRDVSVGGRLREVVSGRCLNQFGLAGSLPEECAFDIRTNSGRRTVYGQQCLRDYGYRIARSGY